MTRTPASATTTPRGDAVEAGPAGQHHDHQGCQGPHRWTPRTPPPSSRSVQAAVDKGIKVIAYDRLAQGPVSALRLRYDNEKVGELQGQALLDAAGRQGQADRQRSS